MVTVSIYVVAAPGDKTLKQILLKPPRRPENLSSLNGGRRLLYRFRSKYE